MNVAGDLEHHDPRALGLHGLTQAARTAVVEVGHDHHAAAAASGRVFSEAFRSGKRKFALRRSGRADRRQQSRQQRNEKCSTHKGKVVYNFPANL